MKRKLLLSLLAIGLVAALIGGATMAWFTDDAVVESAEFVAGTVIVDADGPEIKLPDNKFKDNVNPGDCATVKWNIINDGTKAAQLRVKLEGSWTEDLSNSNVFYAPKEDSGWTMYTDSAGVVWLYYTGAGDAGVPGTYGDTPDADRTILLPLVIGFDGEATGNEYQGATFTIGGKVDAVQASNGAPDAVWEGLWSEVTADGYAATGLAGEYLDYFLEGAGSSMICWTGTEDPEPPAATTYTLTTKVVDNSCSPSYAPERATITLNPAGGTYEEGTEVTLTATPGSYKTLFGTTVYYEFVKWQIKDGANWVHYSTNMPLTVTMDSNKELRAIFDDPYWFDTAPGDAM